MNGQPFRDPPTGPAAGTGVSESDQSPTGSGPIGGDQDLGSDRSSRRAAGNVAGGVLLLAAGVLWLLDTTEAVDLRWRVVLPVVLMVVGVTVTAVSWRRRAGGLVTLGLVLAAMVVVSAFLPDQVGFRIGEQAVRPSVTADLREEYSHGIGDLTIDLTDVVLEQDTVVRAGLGMGDLTVRVPEDVSIVVVASAGAGEVSALGRSSSGVGARLEQTFHVEDAPVLRLELSVGLGQVEVRR